MIIVKWQRAEVAHFLNLKIGTWFVNEDELCLKTHDFTYMSFPKNKIYDYDSPSPLTVRVLDPKVIRAEINYSFTNSYGLGEKMVESKEVIGKDSIIAGRDIGEWFLRKDNLWIIIGQTDHYGTYCFNFTENHIGYVPCGARGDIVTDNVRLVVL